MIIMMTRLDDAAACRRDGATVTAGGHGAAVPGHPAGESSPPSLVTSHGDRDLTDFQVQPMGPAAAAEAHHESEFRGESFIDVSRSESG